MAEKKPNERVATATTGSLAPSEGLLTEMGKVARYNAYSQPSSYIDTSTGAGAEAWIWKNYTGKERDDMYAGLYSQYDTYGSPYYNPYRKATNGQIVNNLKNLGLQMPDNITGDWLQKAGAVYEPYLKKSAYTGSPSSLGSNATAEEQIAYGLYQLRADEMTTQKAEQEWADLKKEITYWTKKGLSDREIKAKINMDKYSTLKKMDDSLYTGSVVGLNRNVGYSKDAIDGVIWKARNEGYDDTDDFTAAVYSRMHSGKGDTTTAYQLAKRVPGTSTYMPYDSGCTDDDARMLFGKDSFTWQDIQQYQMDAYLSGDTDMANMAKRLADAEDTTQAAEQALASLQNWMYKVDIANANIGDKDPYTAIQSIVESQLEEDGYKVLTQMDNARYLGNPLALNRSVKYRKEDVVDELYARYCREKGISLTTSDAYKRTHSIPETAAPAETSAEGTTQAPATAGTTDTSTAFQDPDEVMEDNSINEIKTNWVNTHKDTTTYDPTHCIPLSQTGSGLSGRLGGALLLADAGTSDTGKPHTEKEQRYLNPETNHVYTEQQIRDALRKMYTGVTLTDAEAEAANMLLDSIPWYAGRSEVGTENVAATLLVTTSGLSEEGNQRFQDQYNSSLALHPGYVTSHVTDLTTEAWDATIAADSDDATIQDKVDMAMIFFEDAQKASAEGLDLKAYYEAHPETADDMSEVMSRINERAAQNRAQEEADLKAKQDAAVSQAKTIVSKLMNHQLLTEDELKYYAANMQLNDGEMYTYLSNDIEPNKDYYVNNIKNPLLDKKEEYINAVLADYTPEDPNNMDYYFGKTDAIADLVTKSYAEDAKLAASLGLSLEDFYAQYSQQYSPDLENKWRNAEKLYAEQTSTEDMTEEDKAGIGLIAVVWNGMKLGTLDTAEGYVGAMGDIGELFSAEAPATIQAQYLHRYNDNHVLARNGYRTELQAYAFKIKDTQPEKAQEILDRIAEVDAAGLDVFQAGISLDQEQLADAQKVITDSIDEVRGWLNENATQEEIRSVNQVSSAVSSAERSLVTRGLAKLGISPFLAAFASFGPGIFHSSYEEELRTNGGDKEDAALFGLGMAVIDAFTEGALVTWLYTGGTSEALPTLFRNAARSQMEKIGAGNWLSNLYHRAAALALGSTSASIGETVQELGQNTIEHLYKADWIENVLGGLSEEADAERSKIFDVDEFVDTVISTYLSTQMTFGLGTAVSTISGQGTAFNRTSTIQKNLQDQEMQESAGWAVDQIADRVLQYDADGKAEISEEDLRSFNALAAARLIQGMGLESATEEQQKRARLAVLAEIRQRQKSGILTVKPSEEEEAEEERSISDMSEEELNEMLQNDLDADDDVNEINGEVTNDDIIAQEQEAPVQGPQAPMFLPAGTDTGDSMFTTRLAPEVIDILERTGQAMAPFKEMMEKAAGWLQSITAAQDAVSQAESVLLEGKGYPINYKSTVKQALKALSDLTGIKINKNKLQKLYRQLQTSPIGLLNDLFDQLVEAQDNAQAQLTEAQQKYRQTANDGYIKAGLAFMYTDQATQEKMAQSVADDRTAETIVAGGMTADEETQKKIEEKKEAERDVAKAEEDHKKAQQKVQTAIQNLQNATQNRETDKNGKRELAAAKAVVTAKEEEDKTQKNLQETHDRLMQVSENLNKGFQDNHSTIREQSKTTAGAVVANEGEQVVGEITYNDKAPVSTESSVPAIAPKSLLPDTTERDIEQQNNRSEEEKAADEETSRQVNQTVTEAEAEQQAARQSIDTQAMEDRIYGLRYRDKNNKSRPVTEKRKAASKVNGIVNAFASVEGGMDYFNAMSDEELTALLRDGAFKSVKASTVERTVRDYMRDHPLQGQAAEEQASAEEQQKEQASAEEQAPQTEQKAPVKAPPAKNNAVKEAPDGNPLQVKTTSGDTMEIVGFGKTADGQDSVRLKYITKPGGATVPIKKAAGMLGLQRMDKVYAAQTYWKEHGELPSVQQQEEEQAPAEEQTSVQEEEQTPSEEQEEQQEEEEQAPEEETEKPLTPEEEQAVLDLVARRKQGNENRGSYLATAEGLLGYTPTDYLRNPERKAEIDALVERLQAEVDKRQEKVMTREERDKALEEEMDRQEAEMDESGEEESEEKAPATEQAPSEQQETTAEADEKQTKRDAAKKINGLIDKAYETGEYKYIQQAFDLDTTWSEEHDGEQLFLEDRGALDLDEEAFQKEIETSRARVEAAQEETITLKNTYAQLTAMATGEYEDYNAFTKALRIEAQKLARRTKAFKNGTKTSEQIANSILKHVWDEYQKSRQAQAPQTEQQQAPATEQQQTPQTEQKAPKVKAPATEQKAPKQQEKTQTPPRQKSGAEVYRDMLSRFTKAKKAYDNLLDSGKYKAENYGSMLSTLKGLLKEYGEMLRSGNAGERWFAMRAFAESNTGLLDMLEGLNSEARYQMGMPVGDSLDIDKAIGIAKKAIQLHNAAREALENGDKAKAKINADAFIAYANQFADMAEKIVQDRLGKAEEAGELLKNPENTKAPKKTKKPNTLAKRGKTTNRQNQNGEQEAPRHSPIQTFLRLAEDLNVGEYTRQNRTRLRMKPGVNGVYKGFEDAIGIRGTENNQLETTMHEIGHALENRIGFHGTEEMWNALPASFRDAYKNDLAKLDPDAAHEVRTSEAVAEFVAAYMQSRALAVSIFTEKVVSDFETRLETADRKYQDAFDRAVRETQAYARASTRQQMRVRMSNSMHNRNTKGYLKTMRDGIRGLLSSEVNSTYAAKRFDNAAKDTDLRGFMRMIAFSERAGVNIVTNELRDLNGIYIREGFAQAATIDQKTNKVLIHNTEEADLLSLYSIAMQAIDRYNIAAAEAEETAQDRAIETTIKSGQAAGLTMDQIQAAIDRVLDQISKGVPFASQEEIDAATKRTTVYGDNIGIDKLKAFVQDCQQNHGDIVKAHDQMMSWWQDFMNTYMPAAGVSQDTINYLQAKYPNYVPTMRDMRQGDWSSASSSKAVQGFTMETIKGSDLDVINPLETMQETIIRVVAAARQNQMAGEMYEALDEMMAHPEDREALGNFALIVNGEGDHTITYKDQDGQNHYIEIRDQVLYDAITKGQGNAGDALRTVSKLTRTMAMLTTGNNPLFSAKNFIRDFQHSVNWGTWANNYAFGLWTWFKAAYDVAADSGLLNIAKPVVNFFGGKIQASDTFQQYKALGGGGFTQLGVPSTSRKANAMMRNVIDNYGQNKVTHALSEGASHLLHFATFEKLNSVIETTSRYVEFKYGKHDLTTAEGVREAFLAAQDVTVDFAQNGWSNGAAAMRALVPFYNATVQGSLQTAELLGDLANEKTRGRAMKILAKTAINNVLLGALAYGLLAHFGDDDDKEWYELLADGLKWDNIIVPNFTRDKDKRRYVRLPLSQDPISKTFANLGRVIMQAGDGDQLSLDVGGFVRHVISGIYPNVLTGSIFAPVVALFSNKNYLGNSIVPDYLVDQYKADKTLQTSSTTPEIFNWISRAIYGAIGDTLPPPMIQYLAEQYSGYAGQVLVPILSPDSMNGGHLDPLGALWRVFRNSWTIDPAYTNDVNDAYFDGLDMLETITNSKEKSAIISTSLTDEQAQECQDVAANLISTNGAITQLQNQMTKIREEEAEIRKRTDLNRDTKEAMVKSLVEKEVELKMQAVAIINDFREEYITGTDPIKLMVYGARNVMGPGPLSNLPQQVITDLHDNADYAVTLSDFYSSHKDISKPSMTSTLHGEDGTTYKIPYLFTPDGKPASVEYGNAFSLGMKDAWDLKYSVLWESADDKKKKKIASEMISAGNANAKLWFENKFGVDLK